VDEPRVTVRAIAYATGTPLRTVHRWFTTAPRRSRTAGYPVDVVVSVLADHGIATDANDVATWRAPDDVTAKTGTSEAAILRRLDQMAVAMAQLASATQAAQERERERAAEVIAAREIAATMTERNRQLTADVERLEAQLALPAPSVPTEANGGRVGQRRKPWWQRLLGRD
jgi:hypothetical protein